MKSFFRGCWLGFSFCTQCVLTVVLWTLWLALTIVLGTQIWILCHRELALPAWIRVELQDRLVASGFAAEIGQTTFDPRGHLLIEQITLALPGSSDEPLLRARGVHVDVNPWPLAVGRLVIHQVRVEDGELLLPARLSPSGQSEPVLRDLLFTLIPDRSVMQFPALFARWGNLEISASGALRLPPPTPRAEPNDPLALLHQGVKRYLAVAARLQTLAVAELPRLQSPRLRVEVAPSRDHWGDARVAFTADRWIVPPERTGGLRAEVDLSQVRVTTELPLAARQPVAQRIALTAAALRSGPTRHAQRLQVTLDGRTRLPPFDFQPTQLVASAGSLQIDDWHAPVVEVRTPWPALQPALAVRFADIDWNITAPVFDPQTGRADIRVAPWDVTPALLDLGSRLAQRNLREELQLSAVPRMRLDLQLADGWKLQTLQGDLTVGAVTARTVPLEGASASFQLAGQDLRFDHIELRQGPSVARGSYWMNTASHDYRFLLEGRLQPAGIAGWFHEWWPSFWENFGFEKSTPTADIDVMGRWGSPELATVFVGAKNGPTVLKGTAFDTLDTQVFVRPHFYHGLHFLVTQGERRAHGSFTRLVDLDKKGWAAMDFDVFSNLPLEEGARIFGQEGLEIVEPFHFVQPPQLRLNGHLQGPASPRGRHREVSLAVYSQDEFTFYDFPLRDLSFVGTIRDDHLVLDPITVGFAGGSAEGRVHVAGEGAARELGFDYRLRQAVLGQAIRTLEEFGAKRKKTAMATESPFQKKIATGRLDLAVSAEGKLEDLFSFKGQGNAELSGAELGEVHLLWVLSQLLNKTLFNFSTMKLDTVQSNFSIDGSRLAFSQLRVTGPRAAIEAHGDYFLDRKTLDMKAKLFPFEESDFLLSSAVGFMLSPLSQALEFKLTGPLDKPNWAFVYGPTNFLRKITGGGSADKSGDPASPHASSEETDVPPPENGGATPAPPLPPTPLSPLRLPKN